MCWVYEGRYIPSSRGYRGCHPGGPSPRHRAPPPIRWCDVPDASTPCPAVCRLHMPETQPHCSMGVGDTYLHHIWRLATHSQSSKNPETDRQFRSPWRLHCVPPTGHLTSVPVQGTTAPRRRSPSSPRCAREVREVSAFGILVPPRLKQWNLAIFVAPCAQSNIRQIAFHNGCPRFEVKDMPGGGFKWRLRLCEDAHQVKVVKLRLFMLRFCHAFLI